MNGSYSLTLGHWLDGLLPGPSVCALGLSHDCFHENTNRQLIAGVNIIVKRTSEGTATDADSNFNIWAEEKVKDVNGFQKYLPDLPRKRSTHPSRDIE